MLKAGGQEEEKEGGGGRRKSGWVGELPSAWCSSMQHRCPTIRYARGRKFHISVQHHYVR